MEDGLRQHLRQQELSPDSLQSLRKTKNSMLIE